MGKVYNEAGWVNWDYFYPACVKVCCMVGPRRTGKTYGLLKYLIEHGIKFIYFRRLETQLEIASDDDTNPFTKLNMDYGWNIRCVHSRKSYKFYRTEEVEKGVFQPVGEPLGIGMALKTVANMRGFSGEAFPVIVFDEFVAKENEFRIKKEFESFIDFYETVNRNRESEGQPPVKCFMLGNANRLSNPYYVHWHFMTTALHMLRGQQMIWWNKKKTRMMVLLQNCPHIEEMKKSGLWDDADSGFMKSALENVFATDATNVQSKPLKQCRHLVSVGEIGIYRLKGEDGRYYVSETTSRDNYYEGFGIYLQKFLHDYQLLKWGYFENVFVFENFGVELQFREIFDLEG